MFQAIYENSLAIDETIVRKLTCLLNQTSFEPDISEPNDLRIEDFDISNPEKQKLLDSKETMINEIERLYRYIQTMIQDRKVKSIQKLVTENYKLLVLVATGEKGKPFQDFLVRSQLVHYELLKKFLEKEREEKERLMQYRGLRKYHSKYKVQTTEIKCPYCHVKIKDTESDYYEPTPKISLGSHSWLNSYGKSQDFPGESFLSENFNGSFVSTDRNSPSSVARKSLPRLDLSKLLENSMSDRIIVNKPPYMESTGSRLKTTKHNETLHTTHIVTKDTVSSCGYAHTPKLSFSRLSSPTLLFENTEALYSRRDQGAPEVIWSSSRRYRHISRLSIDPTPFPSLLNSGFLSALPYKPCGDLNSMSNSPSNSELTTPRLCKRESSCTSVLRDYSFARKSEILEEYVHSFFMPQGNSVWSDVISQLK